MSAYKGYSFVMVQVTPFDSPSDNRNRSLANVSPQRDNISRTCNRERLDGRRADGIGNGIRETLVYRSEYRD
jgi:hypothetical protein